MRSYRLSMPCATILFGALGSLLFSPLTVATIQAQSSPAQAGQEVIPYSGNPATTFSTPPASLPYPIQTPTLLATWQGAASGPGAPAAAGVEDRDNTDPTSWWIYTGQTDTDIGNFISANNARIVDIDVNTSVVPFRYTVTYVSNTGPYSSGWWYYLDVTSTTLSNALTANQARLTVLKAYESAGQTRFFAVMIPNTGADAKSWWWYYGQSVAQITSLWQANSARLVQVTSYETTGGKRYAVVMIGNTGADTKSWWWYVGASPSTISTAVASNNARLIDIDYDEASATYSVIMIGCSSGCPNWWWYNGLQLSSVLPTINQDGARAIDFNAVPCGLNTCFTMVLINNSNAETTRVGELLRSHTDGTVGLYLKRVGGSVLASLMNTTTFEPASTIKATTHLYTFRQLASGAAALTSNITKYLPPASGSCPGNVASGVETITLADQEMMWHSDNTRTRELNDHWGVANVNSMLISLGMTSSAINHVIGCGGPPENTTTLADLGVLYEGVANGTLLDPAWRPTFYDHMAGKGQFSHESYDWTGLWTTDIPAIIAQEAPAGMPAALKSAFLANMDLAYKAGNYKICTNGSCTTYKDHISISGWASVPTCGAQPKQFVFGVFIYNASNDTNSGDAFALTKAELLRGPIHDGLATCLHQVYLPLIAK